MTSGCLLDGGRYWCADECRCEWRDRPRCAHRLGEECCHGLARSDAHRAAQGLRWCCGEPLEAPHSPDCRAGKDMDSLSG